MIRKTVLRSSYLYTAVCPNIYFAYATLKCWSAIAGHTARPTDFCWAPHELDNWTATSISEDNVLMIWQPTMRVWAGDAVKIDEKELENDAMEGVESTRPGANEAGPSTSGNGNGNGSGGLRSQSMSVSVDDE